MKLIAQIKLQPDTEQHQTLKQTLEAANAACNRIGDYAWQNRVFGKYKLQKALYYDLKEEFGLSAQMVIRCLAKVSDAYELDKKRSETFSHTVLLPTIPVSCPIILKSKRFLSGHSKAVENSFCSW